MMIQLEKVSKSFDGGKSFALRDISLSVNEGEFIAVIGLSGAGKSTFLRTLNRSLPIEAGKIEVLGKKLERLRGNELAEFRRKIGFIFQQFHLIKSASVLQNILVGRIAYVSLWRSLTGFFPKADLELAKEIALSVGLAGKEEEKIKNLSGGQQQRVAIARALAQEPKLILADEPMASLDPRLAELVLEMLARCNREQGITAIINIHDLALAKKYAKRVLAFRKGTLIFDGTPNQLSEEKIKQIYQLDGEEAL